MLIAIALTCFGVVMVFSASAVTADKRLHDSFFYLGVESTFNMAVVTGMSPTKGLALPFVSYCGSSLVVTLFAVGILLNISTKKV